MRSLSERPNLKTFHHGPGVVGGVDFDFQVEGGLALDEVGDIDEFRGTGVVGTRAFDAEFGAFFPVAALGSHEEADFIGRIQNHASVKADGGLAEGHYAIFEVVDHMASLPVFNRVELFAPVVFHMA